MLLKLIPDETNIRFMSGRTIAVALSILMMIGSVVLVMTRGLNFGVDFKGGIVIEIGADQAIELGDLRSGLGGLGLGEISAQSFGTEDAVLIHLQRQEGGPEAQQAAIDTAKAAIEQIVPGDVSYRRIEYVGPKVSADLVRGGIIAVSVALLASMVYIWLRFEWQFGVGAMFGLIHDVVLTIGLFSIVGLEFNLTIIAAILTIIGYSLNDTVVVFDRVRENLRKFRKMDLAELIDLSLNQTLARTVMTGMTTILCLIALLILGGEVLRGFTAAMLWGILVGTYSTVFIAAPVLPWFKLRRDFGEEAEERP